MNLKKIKIKVYNMTCTSCEASVEKAVKKLDGVKFAVASFSDEFVLVDYDANKTSTDKIKDAIQKAGYSLEKPKNYKFVGMLIIFAAIILIGSTTSGIDMTSRLNGASYLVLFVVGVLTSIHCVGMCGGIMLTQSIGNEGKSKFDSIKPAILYNAGRILSYTILGGLIGALGSVFSMSLSVKAGIQIFAGIFMIIMGLNMSGFAMFRKFNLRLPWSACSIKNKPKTPFFVGMLNGLMPCGPLQTMQLYALGTGSAFNGALSMFLFSLGTVPLMLTFGALSGFMSKSYTKTLLKFSGTLVVVLGLILGSRGLSLAGVNIPTASSMVSSLSGKDSVSAQTNSKPAIATIENGVQVIRMTADGSGYTPNGLYIQKNIPVKWIIDGKSLNSCNNSIIIPSLNKEVKLKNGENVIEFTPGDKDIAFSCWMGMIRGVIKVVDDVSVIDTSKADSSIPAPSSGMPCCTGQSASAPVAPSIYGTDLSKVSTDRLIQKSKLSNNKQTVIFNGIGYEFEPLIAVVNRNTDTSMVFNLDKFDNPEGTFEITASGSKETLISFEGQKGTVTSDYSFSKSGIYVILKDKIIIGAIVVQDNIEDADLEKIRKDLLGN